MVSDPAEAEMMYAVAMHLQEIPVRARSPQRLDKLELHFSAITNGNLEVQIHRNHGYSVQYGL